MEDPWAFGQRVEVTLALEKKKKKGTVECLGPCIADRIAGIGLEFIYVGRWTCSWGGVSNGSREPVCGTNCVVEKNTGQEPGRRKSFHPCCGPAVWCGWIAYPADMQFPLLWNRECGGDPGTMVSEDVPRDGASCSQVAWLLRAESFVGTGWRQR